MRLKSLGNQERVYMNPNDYQTILDCAESRRAEVAMRIMGQMGLRVSEIGFSFDDIRQSTHPDVDLWFVTIYGKDTSGETENGKRRDAWMPDDLKARIERYMENERRTTTTPIIGETPRTISRDVKQSAKNAALKTDNEDFEYISCHDFRAYFATNMLLREGVDPEIVMELGGWVDRETIDPYLNASFDDIIRDELAAAGVIEDAGETRIDRIEKQLGKIVEAINEIDPGAINTDEEADQTALDGFS